MKININNKLKFVQIVNKINNSDSFKDFGMQPIQEEAIEKYAGFLSLVPEKYYSEIAFGLLREIQDFNLSIEGYRFCSLDLKSKEKTKLKQDLKIATKYLITIENSPCVELIALVKKNIIDLQNKLAHVPIEDGVINFEEYRTIGLNQYDDYSMPSKHTKMDIKNWLVRTLKRYNITGCSLQVKRLTDSL